MENYKGEVYPRTLDAIYKDFDKAIKAIDGHFASNPIKLKDIATLYQGDMIINKDALIGKFGLHKYVKRTKYYGRDLKGLYVFATVENDILTYKYVGISRSLLKRIKDHVFGKTKHMATLANLMAKHRYLKEGGDIKLYDFNKDLLATQQEIKNWYVALYPIECSFELHMAEPHLSYHWKSYWNTFETH